MLAAWLDIPCSLSRNDFFLRHLQLKSLFMACDPNEDSDISGVSCLDQCFRVDSFFLAFSWLPVSSGLFMTSARGTVCPSEMSLCINPVRSFWQLCSGTKTLQCPTSWHPLPRCLNSDKISSSWNKYTECESSRWPTCRCLIPESEIAVLGHANRPAPVQQCSSLNFSVPLYLSLPGFLGLLGRILTRIPSSFPHLHCCCLCFSYVEKKGYMQISILPQEWYPSTFMIQSFLLM